MFTFGRRKASIGVLKTRRELHGDEAILAIDVPISFTVNQDDLANLVPDEVGLGSVLSSLWDDDGNFRSVYISSIPIDRKPEGLNICIIDQPTNASRPRKTPLATEAIYFENVNIKSPTLSNFDSDGHAQLSFMIQISGPKDDAVTRLGKIIDESRFITIDQPQIDMFEDGNNNSPDGEASEAAE